MAISNEDISYAMENSLAELPELPGKFEKLNFPGIKAMWTPPATFVFPNHVTSVRLDTQNVETTIQAVHDFYTNNGKSYWWMVTRMTTPTDLRDRLQAAGLNRFAEFSGMVLRDLSIEIKQNSKVRVRVATEDDIEDVIDLYVRGYPATEDSMRVWVPLIEAAGGHNYLAFLEGHDKPVSIASMFYMPGRPIAVLQGAATLPEFRGNGLYTSLVARRLADARADGMEAVILQADRTTSAPICQRLGFQEVHAIEGYGWFVESDGGH